LAAALPPAGSSLGEDADVTIHSRPRVSPEACPALVLNADFRPLSYYPLSLWSWQDSIKAVFLDRVNIVSSYDRTVRSPSFEMLLPSVIALKTYVKACRFPAFTRFNVFLRDHFSCQYCGSREDLTFDHLIPRSKGGTTTWKNVVAACSSCNLRKGDRLPADARMWPTRMPYQPSVSDLHQNGRRFPPNYLHESWLDYLYWDSVLEP
jgi:5-methylcytosine-specific restriction endonuclease McrA